MKLTPLNIILIAICIVLLYLWLRKPKPESFNEKPYQDSIAALAAANKTLKSQNTDLFLENARLDALKQQVKVIYKEKKVFLQGSSITQLDSFIRASAIPKP